MIVTNFASKYLSDFPGFFHCRIFPKLAREKIRESGTRPLPPDPSKNSCSDLFQRKSRIQSIMQQNQKFTFSHLKKSPGFPVLDIFGLSTFEKLFDFFVFDVCDFFLGLYVTSMETPYNIYVKHTQPDPTKN
jgi:hypothetical protein